MNELNKNFVAFELLKQTEEQIKATIAGSDMILETLSHISCQVENSRKIHISFQVENSRKILFVMTIRLNMS